MGLDCFLKGGSSSAPLADLFFSIPGVHISRAGTLENHKETRQLKPTRSGRSPPQKPVKKNTVVHPSDCPRDSGWPTDSSAPPKHTRDSDWRYSQSRCNPDTDTHWQEGNVGASGTNQHRQIFLKRWKACLSPGVLGICRAEPHPACTDKRMPQYRPKMLST